MAKLIRGDLRPPGTWGAQLEPASGLSPLAVVVGAALAAVLFAGSKVEDFVDSAVADRNALLARHRWEAARGQQQDHDCLTDEEVQVA